METIRHEKPNLKHPKCGCDQPLHKQLDKYAITSLMNKSHYAGFIGGPGSGKTDLFVSLLQTSGLFKQVFDKIYLFMPANSLNSLEDSVLNTLPPTQIFDEVTLPALQAIFENAKADATEATKKKEIVKNTLIIFDDVQDAFKVNILEKYLKKILCNRRHAHVSVWMAVQNYSAIAKQTRKHLTDLFIFSCSKSEMETVFNEKIQTQKHRFEYLLDEVLYQHPHDFFYINPDSKRIFNHWTEEITFPNKKRKTIEDASD